MCVIKSHQRCSLELQTNVILTDKTRWCGSHLPLLVPAHGTWCSYTQKVCWLQALFMIWLILFHIFRLTEHSVNVRLTSRFILQLCSEFRDKEQWLSEFKRKHEVNVVFPYLFSAQRHVYVRFAAVSLLKPLGFRWSAALSFWLSQLFSLAITVWVNRGGKWLRKVNWPVLLSSVAPWLSVVCWGEPVLESAPADTLCPCLTDGWPAHPFPSPSLSDWGNEAVAMQKQVTADRHWLPHQRNWSPSNERYEDLCVCHLIFNIFRYFVLAHSFCPVCAVW